MQLHPFQSTSGAARHQPAALALALLLALAAGGCSNTPLKSDKLLLAREALAHATQMGGNADAPTAMQAARERLDLAQAALTAGKLAQADALSDEVLVNTRLAESRVQSVKAQQAATELNQDRRVLQIEIQNNLK